MKTINEHSNTNDLSLAVAGMITVSYNYGGGWYTQSWVSPDHDNMLTEDIYKHLILCHELTTYQVVLIILVH